VRGWLSLARASMSKPKRISYIIILLMFVLAGGLHMATVLVAALFSYFALVRLSLLKQESKWLPLGLFVVLLAGIAYALAFFINQTVTALPGVAEKAVPSMIGWAQEYNVELPFTDYESLKSLAFDTVKDQVHTLGSFANFARGATRQFVFLIIGCVVAISIFLNARMELDRESHADPNNLYSACCDEIAGRFALFFRSFSTVMGAQIAISAINTVLTSAFVFSAGLPNAVVIIGVTFLCGLLPVVGNLISNTIIVAIGFTVTPKMALLALLFLVVIHKLEYFLNSKIIGGRIRNPIWLTLLGLVVGEKLMGIPGMILAPVVLHYLKMETAQLPAKTDGDKAGQAGADGFAA
jgi:predicted PurR-regulated permease PerM